jgi:hypothetical protein
VTNAEEDDAVVDDGGGQSDVSAALRMRGVARFRRCVERAGGNAERTRRSRVSERTTACVMTQDGRVAGIVAAACPSPRGAVLARARLRASRKMK